MTGHHKMARESLPEGNGGIAVIGMAGRFPGAADCEKLWENLRRVASSIRETPSSRWDAMRYYSPDREGINKTVSKWGGYIDDVDKFDPMFFGISPREARLMDPQQRILLELAWTCLEDAGYPRETLLGSRTGVFIGVMNFDYRERMNEEVGAIEGHMSTGAFTALIPNRISHFFDWRGPSLPIDTACSSSLVALHEAVHSLLRGECEQALVGGVSVLCNPTHCISFSKTGMLSRDGLCRTFDDRANGYVRSEGAALLLLKRLSRAIEDGDRIHGVIRGSAVNHGGNARTVTYPNPQAQADVIATAYEQAGIPPDSVGYIEAHGTGTPKGDPIEISGLKTAFARLAEHFDCRVGPRSCGLGSLKANIGHLEPVAGIAGVIKVLLAMKRRTLPGLAHFQRLNHRIDLTDSPFFIVVDTQDWPEPTAPDGRSLPRRAGVSSFGFGGVNAHVVVEEWTGGGDATGSASAVTGPVNLIVLSAKTSDALRASARRLLDWLKRSHPQDPCLADIAYTLQVGRSAMEERLGVVAETPDDLARKLESFVIGGPAASGVYVGAAHPQGQDVASADVSPETAAGWVADGRGGDLLERWVKGLEVDWNALYGANKAQRIGLPSYPFARESYWLPGDGRQKGDGAQPEQLAAAPDLMYFEERWVEQPLGSTTVRPFGTIVCFASRKETRQAVAEFLGASGRQARLIFVAEAASDGPQTSASTEIVVRDDPESFLRAIERIQARHGRVDAVLYWWPLEDRRYVSDFSPIVCLIQALGASRMTTGSIVLAARGGDGESRCHWESLLGLERSAGMALPNTAIAVMYESSDRPLQQGDLQRWAEITWAELQTDKIQSCLYRNGQRHVCRVEPVEIASARPVLRSGGTYLITGGLGGLGRLFAEHLISNYAAQVALVGRSALDEAKKRRLDALSAVGAVLYFQADVCDVEEMQACLAAVKARFGPLHGVIHAAGVESWKSIHAGNLADFLHVLDPKIQGTLALDEALRDEPIDFLCHFSSSSAVIGDFGACSYAIGNRFQMAHARYRQDGRRAGRTLAINWPLWKDGGMHVGDAESTEFYLKSTGQRLLEVAEGKQIFERLLGWGGPQCLVMSGEPARIRRMLKLEDATVRTVASATPTIQVRRDALPGAPLLARVEADLVELASQLLQVSRDRLSIDRSLANFGFDSINMAAFSAVLSRRYSVDVAPSLFFSFPTLGRLARHFVEQHRAAVEACYRDDGAAAQIGPVGNGDSAKERKPESRIPASPGEGPSRDEPVAVIGMSGRFPGARSVAEMWRILAEGRSVVTVAPADRDGGWVDSVYRCGFMPEISEFDPLFFEISPREADSMDPRQRLLLEETWKALEDAGYGPDQLATNRVGVFVGVEDGDYQRLEDGERSITSNHTGVLAGRLAYYLDLTGPTLSINTACSSGLVALHQACLSLRNDECDCAIVAAANLFATSNGCGEMSRAGMLSPEGTCYAFDERANGMVPGEAVVALVLRRLPQARAGNDRIRAIIAGSGVNSDGRTNGVTAPNGASQSRLIESVYRRHAIDPGQIECVVAHGTGTRLGDPVEVNALIQAFRTFTQRSGYCALTSTKPNLGHALAASGLVSVVSLIEALGRETIPASLNWERPNPFIQFDGSPFFVNAVNRPWPRRADRPRLGAVSAFGMSGTNAHMALQDYVGSHPEPAREAVPCCLFVLSAKTEKALGQKIADMIGVFESDPGDAGTFADISYTLLERRRHFDHRCAFVAGSAQEAARILRMAGGEALPVRFFGKAPRDFRPQPAQQRYAEDLVEQCASSFGDGAGFREGLRALAELFCQGYSFDGMPLLAPAKPRVATLPAYPFSRGRHWIRPAPSADATGVVEERMRAARRAPSSEPRSDGPGRNGSGLLLLTPVWEPVDDGTLGSLAPPGGRFVVIGGTGQDLRAIQGADHRDALLLRIDELAATETILRRLGAHGWIDHVVWLAPDRPQPAPVADDSAIHAQQDGVLACFRLIKALLALGYDQRELNWFMVTVQAQAISASEAIDATHSGLHGLMGSLAKERLNWKIRLADLPSHDAAPLGDLLSLPADPRGHAWVYRHGEWYRRQLVPVRPVGERQGCFRRQGVYVVIGGAGDIGEAWSEDMIAAHDARIVWVGRRERDARIEAKLARLARIGKAPLYFRADAGKLDELRAVKSAVLGQYGAIHGVVHAAMVFGNHELGAMTESQFKAALYAKVDVSVRLAQVFANDPLDFLLFFSSMISLIKNPRQAHYAAGSTFKDAFAHQLAQSVSCPVKVVNWGYWAAKKNADAPEVRQFGELGIGLIEPDEGMRALEILLASPLQQMGVMKLTRAFEVEGMSSGETMDLYPAPITLGRSSALSPLCLFGGLQQ